MDSWKNDTAALTTQKELFSSSTSTDPMAATYQDYDMFVFAGQSNMMGACGSYPKADVSCGNSYEYKYRDLYSGKDTNGRFELINNPCGEWLYKDTSAYDSDNCASDGLSTTTDFANNTFFVSAMNNNEKSFADQSESVHQTGASLPAYFAKKYEELGYKSIIAHIAKGSTNISYYFTSDMASEYNSSISEYNSLNGTSYASMGSDGSEAATIFDDKVTAMISDFPRLSSGEIRTKNFVWLQGESDYNLSTYEYKIRLQVLWNHMKTLGFERFLMVRVGYWSGIGILNVIKAQEEFSSQNSDVYMVTRACSFFPHGTFASNSALYEQYYVDDPMPEYKYTRDSTAGIYANDHVNERGFIALGERMAKNTERILRRGLDSEVEKEILNL